MKKEDNWNDFLRLCQKIKTERQWDHFLKLFLTIKEREAIMKRYSITKLLFNQRLTQRQIAKSTKTSIANITRGSNYIKGMDRVFKQFLTNHLKG